MQIIKFDNFNKVIIIRGNNYFYKMTEKFLYILSLSMINIFQNILLRKKHFYYSMESHGFYTMG